MSDFSDMVSHFFYLAKRVYGCIYKVVNAFLTTRILFILFTESSDDDRSYLKLIFQGKDDTNDN